MRSSSRASRCSGPGMECERPSGSISRYHNPDNYTVALGAVIRDKQLKVQQRLQLMSGGGRGAGGETAGVELEEPALSR